MVPRYVVFDKEKLKALPEGNLWFRRLENLEDFYTKHVKHDYIVVDKNEIKNQ